jgi:radical SAM protein with 4Fe4S-binding SPASM domain
MVVHGVDVLNVVLDAWTPELYSQLQSPNDPSNVDLDAVVKRLDRVPEIRRRHQSVNPIVVPEMTKARQNVHELDEFHDGWLRRIGTVLVSGHSHCAGQCEDHSVIQMAPSPRAACRRIHSRCLVLADGRVTTCDQDLNGRYHVGRLTEHSLSAIWNGEALARIRNAHRQSQFDITPLCSVCDDWHRP